MSKAKTKRAKPRKATIEKATAPGGIAEALEDLVKGLDKIADKIGDVVNELDRAASATELEHDVGEEKAFCDYEGCEEYAVTKRCREHSLFVEQVWVVCVAGLHPHDAGAMSVRASERSARDIIKDRLKDWNLPAASVEKVERQLEKWDGNSDAEIGPFYVRVETVEL